MKTAEEKKRLYFIDIIRGILIIYVVYYHFMYDLNDIVGEPIPYLYSHWFSTIRDIMSGTLIFISGISCNFSRNNIKRGIKTLAAAMVLTAVTYFVMPSQTILFGILHLLGSMMLIYGVGQQLTGNNLLKKFEMKRLYARLALMVLCFVAFFAAFHIYYGYLSFFSIKIELPSTLYGSFPMYILGFHGPFASADYYPLLPWGMLFMAGAMAGYFFKSSFVPKFFYKNFSRPLAFIGRHTMVVYIIHQPVLMGIFMLMSYIV